MSKVCISFFDVYFNFFLFDFDFLFVFCLPLGHNDMTDVVTTHIDELQSLFVHQVKKPWILVSVESNLGLEASHIAHLLANKPKVVCLAETGPDGKHGVLTTHQRKIEFVAITQQLLMTNAMSINKHVISKDAAVALADLKKQLHNYKKINSEISGGSAFGMPKVSYSGKVSETGKLMAHAFQDDLCITLQLAAYWSTYILQRKCRFLDYANIFG